MTTVVFRLNQENKLKIEWREIQDETIRSILQMIGDITKTYHYKTARKGTIQFDASHREIGATLVQEFEPALWAPIAFTSGFLNAAEQKKIVSMI